MSKDYTWQTTLNEIADLNMGQSPDSSFVGAEMLGPAFLQGCAEFGPKYPNAVLFCSKPKKISCVGDTLMSVRAPVGEINKADCQYCIGRGLAAITFKNGISNDFGWHLLKFWGARLNNVSQGSTFSAISKDDLADLTVFIFEEDAQKAIALILDTLDNLIFQTEAVIEKLSKIRAGLLQDLLTKGIDENGEIRDSEKHPEQFKDSSLGRIPKDWDVIPLGEICEKIQDGTHFSPKSSTGPCRYITSKNIRFGYMDLSDCNYISQKEHEIIFRRCDTKKDDILLTKDGASTGNAALNPFDEEVSLLSSVAFLRCDEKELHSRFLLQCILSEKCQKRISDLMSGNAITRLTLTKIKAFEIAKPKYDEQVEIAKAIYSIVNELESNTQNLSKLELLKKGLLQDLLTSKVSVARIAEKADKPAKIA